MSLKLQHSCGFSLSLANPKICQPHDNTAIPTARANLEKKSPVSNSNKPGFSLAVRGINAFRYKIFWSAFYPLW